MASVCRSHEDQGCLGEKDKAGSWQSHFLTDAETSLKVNTALCHWTHVTMKEARDHRNITPLFFAFNYLLPGEMHSDPTARRPAGFRSPMLVGCTLRTCCLWLSVLRSDCGVCRAVVGWGRWARDSRVSAGSHQGAWRCQVPTPAPSRSGLIRESQAQPP